jgi:hypothetical protein
MGRQRDRYTDGAAGSDESCLRQKVNNAGLDLGILFAVLIEVVHEHMDDNVTVLGLWNMQTTEAAQ